ncbi:MAG: hypothetical protein ACR2QV_12350 [Gammaproteobacteria bacterium]
MVRPSHIRSVAVTVAIFGLAPVGPALADIDPVTGENVGDTMPQNFDELCRTQKRIGEARGETMQQELRTRFYAELERAERALAAGNAGEASDTLYGAAATMYMGGREGSMLSVKCLGEPTARRWFNVNLGVWRLATGDQRLEIGARDDMRYSLFADGADDVATRVRNVPAKRFKGSFRAVQDAVDMIESEREFGAFILQEEEQVVAAGGEALASLREFADGKIGAALNSEAVAFSRPATEQERQAGQLVGATGQIAQAMTGVDVDIDTEAQQQAMLVNLQTVDSMVQLEQARYYEIDGDESRTNRRAEERGDTLLARADDDALALEARDNFYGIAESYYRFCYCDRERNSAERKRAAIQPALEAQRAEQQRKMDDARADLEKKAEAARESLEKMQKTEAEKKVFKEEADAMEAELGF